VTSPPAEQFGDVQIADEQFADEQFRDPSTDVPRELPEPPCTGDEAVDAAVQQLSRIADEPLEDQLGVYDTVHRTLQDRLADVEG
jgi:hypothetical protein